MLDADGDSEEEEDESKRILRKPTRSNTTRADIRNFVAKQYVKNSAFKELIRHLLFIVIMIVAITLHRSTYENFLMNEALITAFVTQQIEDDLQPFPKTFLDIGQPDEFRDWLVSVVGGTLDTNSFYNGKEKTAEQQEYVMFNNRLLGGVRLRQLRAAPNKGCRIPSDLRNITKTCYSYDYFSNTRETKPFGPPEDPTKYTYAPEAETGSVGVFGYQLTFIDGGGYVTDVNLEDRDRGINFTSAFQSLIDDMWFDNTTRAIVISMAFLNIELESRVAVLYLFVEIPGDGVFFPNYMIKTFRYDLYMTGIDFFRMSLEIAFVCCTVYSIYAEIHEMANNYKVHGRGLRKYFFNGWNLLELVDIILYLTVIGLYLKYLLDSARFESLAIRTYKPELEQLAATALAFYNVCSINMILTTFRTFKYLRLNHRLYLLWKALQHAGADLVGFLFIFLIFIFGFIFMGWLSFGSDLEFFNTFVHSFATCWNFIIGNPPDYDAMFHSNRVLGPIFFVLFTIFIFFILANMFIAILSNSFDVVNSHKEEESKIKDAFEEKLAEVAAACKKLYYTVTKQSYKKRSMIEILDNLEHPEILDQPNLTVEDVARAIGSNGTPMEVEDLYLWIKKAESSRQGKAKNASASNSTSGVFIPSKDNRKDKEGIADDERAIDSSDQKKKKLRRVDAHVNETLKQLQADMIKLQADTTEVKQLLQFLINNK